jgi:hypothetical protein
MVTKLFCTLIATRSKTIFWTSFKFFGLIILNKSSTQDDNWSSISSMNQFVMLRDKKLVWGGVFSFLYILIKSRNRYEPLCMCICNCLFQSPRRTGNILEIFMHVDILLLFKYCVICHL